MRRLLLAMVLTAFCGAAGFGAAVAAEKGPDPIFVYDDLDSFGAALAKVDGGAPAEATFAEYMARGSAAFPGYVERYDVTAQSIAKAVAKRPKHFHRVAAL